MDAVGGKLCGICSTGGARYQCPRCNVLYCSAECYKSSTHSDCSEQFYEECVRNEMSSVVANNEESQKKMIDILKRLNETFDSDEQLDSDDDDANLAERLKGIDLDEADKVWDKLTDTEKRQFEEFVKSGDVTEVMPEYEAWWDYKDDRKVIDLDEVSPFVANHKYKCPEIYEEILPLAEMSKTTPAPTVCFNLTNLLAAYVFVVRYFNGDHHDCVSESAFSIINLSKNLSNNDNYFDFQSAVKSVSVEVTNSSFLVVKSCDTIEDDVGKIFQGPDCTDEHRDFYVLAALSDMHRLFSKAVKTYNSVAYSSRPTTSSEFFKRFPESSTAALPNVKKLKIKTSVKKVEYYMSWTKEFCNSFVNINNQ